MTLVKARKRTFAGSLHDYAASGDVADHLIEMPTRRRGRPAPFQIAADLQSELDGPAPDGLIADLDPR